MTSTARTKPPIGTLPQPTMAQRVASMGDFELLMAAERLATSTDAASAEAGRAVGAELQRRGIRL